MQKKLTLSLDEAAILKGKQFAKFNDTSLSEMFERYLLALQPVKKEWHPDVLRLKGALKGSKVTNVKEAVERQLKKKYL